MLQIGLKYAPERIIRLGEKDYPTISNNINLECSLSNKVLRIFL